MLRFFRPFADLPPELSAYRNRVLQASKEHTKPIQFYTLAASQRAICLQAKNAGNVPQQFKKPGRHVNIAAAPIAAISIERSINLIERSINLEKTHFRRGKFYHYLVPNFGNARGIHLGHVDNPAGTSKIDLPAFSLLPLIIASA